MDTDVKKCNFERAPQWKRVYKQNGTGAGLGVYVDDFELQATPEDTQSSTLETSLSPCGSNKTP